MIRVKEVEINFDSAWKRLGLLLLISAASAWAGLHLSAQIRGTRAANAVGGTENLEAALAYDPSQAEVHTRLGFYYLYDPFLFDPSQAVHHCEAAVRLHPFDSEAWSNLARAYEQQDDVARAERAYAIAIDLAPNHFYPRWVYGNFLLRQAELEPAFSQFGRVADAHLPAIDNICELIWQTTGGDAEALVRFGMGLRSGASKARVCHCLSARGDHQRAVAVWKTVAERDPIKIDAGQSLISSLVAAGQWSPAHLVWQEVIKQRVEKGRQLSPADLAFWNGDFEYDTMVAGFDWNISSTEAVKAGFDPFERYHGNRSLLLEFRQHQKVSFNNAVHDLWVERPTRYILRFYYKTENVPEKTSLYVVLSDAESPTRFNIQSEELGNEDQWTKKEIGFEIPTPARVVRLSIVRKPRAKLFDYMDGKVWFDSFTLEPASNESDRRLSPHHSAR